MDSAERNILIGAAAALAVGTGLALWVRSRRVGGLRGLYTKDNSKLASKDADEVTLIWKVPPGPAPSSPGRARRQTYRQLCSTMVNAGAFRARGPRGWMRELLPTGQGTDPWRSPRNQPMKWWVQGGTCPGCSQVCGLACYGAVSGNYNDWGARRSAWTNLCDVVAGKPLPEIVEGRLRGRSRAVIGEAARITKQRWDPRRGPQARPVGPLAMDYWSQRIVVDPAKVNRVWVRVHEVGDFWDVQYARSWYNFAKRHVARYKRELARFRRGQRTSPPVRVLLWAYTRSWRDRRFHDILRSFSKLQYPAAVDNQGKPIPEQDAFAIWLSSDADTGVPWMRDKRGRIMPVAYLMTAMDTPLIPQLVNKVPGVVLKDYDLRKDTDRYTAGAFVCPAEKLTPEAQAELASHDKSRPPRGSPKSLFAAWRKGREEIIARYKRGCGVGCGVCRPGASQRIADALWAKFQREARVGVPHHQVAETGLAMRADDTTEYERFMRSRAYWRVAVPPPKNLAQLVAEEVVRPGTVPVLRRTGRIERLTYLARQTLARKGKLIPTVPAQPDDAPVRRMERKAVAPA